MCFPATPETCPDELRTTRAAAEQQAWQAHEDQIWEGIPTARLPSRYPQFGVASTAPVAQPTRLSPTSPSFGCGSSIYHSSLARYCATRARWAKDLYNALAEDPACQSARCNPHFQGVVAFTQWPEPMSAQQHTRFISPRTSPANSSCGSSTHSSSGVSSRASSTKSQAEHTAAAKRILRAVINKGSVVFYTNSDDEPVPGMVGDSSTSESDDEPDLESRRGGHWL